MALGRTPSLDVDPAPKSPRPDQRVYPLQQKGTDSAPGIGKYAAWLIRRKAWQLIRSNGFRIDDLQDIQQELALHLLLRLPKFDPSKASLRTFQSRLVDHAAATIAAYRRAGCRDFRTRVWSLDESVGSDDEWAMARHEVVTDSFYRQHLGQPDPNDPDRLALKIDLDREVARLPGDLPTLCGLLANYSVAEVARRQGVSRSTIYERIARIRGLLGATRVREYVSNSGQFH